MIKYAFCYNNEEELNFMVSEIKKCFKIRDIEISISTYRCAYELLKSISTNCPDIIFYNYDEEDGLIHEAALAARDKNKNLVTVITNKSGDDEDTQYAEERSLEQSYVLPSLSRRHLWMYACLAYDAFLDDHESFTYYVRPDYFHIPISDVMYFASEGRRTHLVSHRKRDTFYQRLDEVENLIKEKGAHFVRVHQSFLVNTQFIVNYNREYVTLLNGERIRISKYHYYRNLTNKVNDSDLPIKKIANYC